MTVIKVCDRCGKRLRDRYVEVTDEKEPLAFQRGGGPFPKEPQQFCDNNCLTEFLVDGPMPSAQHKLAF